MVKNWYKFRFGSSVYEFVMYEVEKIVGFAIENGYLYILTQYEFQEDLNYKNQKIIVRKASDDAPGGYEQVFKLDETAVYDMGATGAWSK